MLKTGACLIQGLLKTGWTVYQQSEETYPRLSPLEKEKMEVVLLNQVSKKQKNLIVSSHTRYVFTKTVHNQVPLLDGSVLFMDEIVVTKEGVTKLLKGLNPSKALGPNELHPSGLKELAKEIRPIFAHPLPAINQYG